MRKILIIQLLLLVFIGCKQTDSNKVLICGYAMNGTDSEIVLYKDEEPVDSTMLNKKSEFCLRLDSLQAGLYNFRIGDEYQYLYLQPGDSIALSTNMIDFDESLAFSGKGADINNFMLSMYLVSEKDRDYLSNFYFIPISDFTKKIDSLLSIRENYLTDFKTKNHDEKVRELAEISATYDLFAMKELYAKFYSNFKDKSMDRILPNDYYSYRKKVLVNSEFSYHRSFFNYAQAYINNETYHICSKEEAHSDIERKDFYHSHKLSLIDSIYGIDRKLKENLYRRAIYAYFFNLSNENNIEDYISQVEQHIGESKVKQELDSLFIAAENLKKGKNLPNIQLLDNELKEFSVNDILSHKKNNILYMISSDETEISSYIEDRIHQLKTLFSDVNFIGITIGGNYEDWKKRHVSNSEFFAKNPILASRKLLFYNPNKIIVVDKNNKIINAFGSIFNIKLEKDSLKN